jgi:hypothetical protein
LITTPYSGGGGFVFFDANYAELSVGFFAGGGEMEAKIESNIPDVPVGSSKGDTSITALTIGLLGKYPIALNQNLKVFPLLGIDYLAVLSLKDEDGDEYTNADGKESPGDFSALWFKFGVGADVALTQKVYLRIEALYGIRLANKFENDLKDELDAEGQDYFTTKTLLGHGLTIKLAAGFKL